LNARRAKLRDAFVESFHRKEIFERDGWICGLCHDPIDKDLPWPHPMSASLDHIIPISRDGKHCRANAQASHFVCNIRKGNRMAA
jgi:5-methylcytosine-specific restriction endonuclease McrA